LLAGQEHGRTIPLTDHHNMTGFPNRVSEGRKF
jgi:hypothetical protein